MMMTTATTRRRAFTLLEVLLATTIGVLIAAGAAGVFRSIVLGREKAQQHVDAAAPLRVAADQLRQDLHNLCRSSQTNQSRFVGSTDRTEHGFASRLVFYTISSRKARPEKPEADIYEVEYFLQQTEDRSVLMRRLWPNPSRNHSPAGLLAPLADNIVAFEVAYADGENWVYEWPEKLARPPQLLAVTLVSQVGDDPRQAATQRFLFHPPRYPNQAAASPPQEASAQDAASSDPPDVDERNDRN